MQQFVRWALTAFVLFVGSSAKAATILLNAILTGGQVIDPTGSQATGNASVVLDRTDQIMQVTLGYQALFPGGFLVAVDIHCCVQPDGVIPGNLIVALTMPNVPAVPTGTYVSTPLDLNMSVFNPAFVTAEGGLVQAR
ncbi:MAG: hypothetical protein WBW27_26920, partial [Pseudolabrys sp.]